MKGERERKREEKKKSVRGEWRGRCGEGKLGEKPGVRENLFMTWSSGNAGNSLG